MAIVAGALLGLVGLGVAATVVARLVLERRLAGEIDALLAEARPAASATVSEDDLKRLPEPVARWLRYAQVVDKARPTTVRLRQEGEFRLQARGGGGLNQGDLLRFLGELQWFPAGALVDYLSWEPLAADAARATISHGGIQAAMSFRFGADGRLLEERAIRYNDARGRNESWVNCNDADGEFGGIRVPVVGEARWEYDSGPYPYIRRRITDLEQDWPARY